MAATPFRTKTSLAAAEQALALAATLGPDDLLIALISGGASALMSKPVPGISIEEKFGLVKAVLKCGANIAELNCVRKQVSAVKGGRLARAAGQARIHTLALSDVPGDDPAIIGSGPTVPIRRARRMRSPSSSATACRCRQSVAALARRARMRTARSSARTTETRVIVSPHESFRAVRAKAEAHGPQRALSG